VDSYRGTVYRCEAYDHHDKQYLGHVGFCILRMLKHDNTNEFHGHLSVNKKRNKKGREQESKKARKQESKKARKQESKKARKQESKKARG